ncbi:MAG: hypothetical protein ABI779_19670 [Acidobacteriota bacterium]
MPKITVAEDDDTITSEDKIGFPSDVLPVQSVAKSPPPKFSTEEHLWRRVATPYLCFDSRSEG